MDSHPFGIDFGGSGIKGAPVDLAAGDFAADRVKIKTPKPSTPEAVAEVFAELLSRFPDSTGSVGVTVPAVVRHGVVSSAANIDRGGSARTPTRCSPRRRAATSTWSTTPTRRAWPR